MKKKLYSPKKLSIIISVSERTIRRWCDEGKISEEFLVKEPSRGRKGYRYKINPKGLPKKHRNEYKAWLAKHAETSLNHDQSEARLMTSLKPWQRDHVMPYYLNIKKAEQYGLKGKSLKTAIDHYNREHPDQGDLNIKSFYRNWKLYREGGLEAIIPEYGKNAGETKIPEDIFKTFDSLYMTQNRRSVTECWKKTLGAAKNDGRVVLHEGKYWMLDSDTGELTDTFPHHKTFKREIERRYSEDAIILARRGEQGLRKTQADYFLNRDLTGVPAGEVWVSDHRQLDVLVSSSKKSIKRFAKSILYDMDIQAHDRKKLEQSLRRAVAANFSGRPTRLWCTAWIDFKTGKWLSWYLHEDAPNTDHVLLSFKWAVQKYGLPKDVIIDNGKDYRARDIAGGRTKNVKADIDKSYTQGIFYGLEITPHFAIPYNARAKTIERQFRFWIESFEKDFPTYTGKNPSERPEITTINARNGKYPTAIDLIAKFDRFIPLLNQQARNGRELDGLSPEVVWNREFTVKRAMRPEELKFIAMRSSNIKKLVGNGFYDRELDHHYYHPQVAEHVGERVFIKRDPEQWDIAYVHRASDGEFLFTATIDLHIPGINRTAEEQAALSQASAHQNERRAIRREQLKGLRKITAEEGQRYYEGYIELQNELMEQEHNLAQYEQKKVIEMQNTDFGKIVEKVEQMKRTGTDDLDDIAPEEPAGKSKLKDIWDE